MSKNLRDMDDLLFKKALQVIKLRDQWINNHNKINLAFKI